MCARVRAAQLIIALSDKNEITTSDAPMIHEALGFLEEAMWQLDVQYELAPTPSRSSRARSSADCSTARC
ncbi:hypothetical protein ACWGE0_11915 [Lentzea sp. NPDC054927]